jgi:phosphohistidine phosphatase SixA
MTHIAALPATHWRTLWLSLGCALIAGTLALAQSAAAAMLSGQPLLQQLRAGGYVLVMRHAQAPTAAPTGREAEPDNMHHERQLNEAGKASARELGAALDALQIPIGPIYSSPTFRALQTIRLAGLGTPRVVPELAEGAQGMASAAERPQIAWLRLAVEKFPPPDHNTLIVTHTPNIVGAFGHGVTDIKAGEMLVFKPEGTRPASLIGRITIDEWRQLARKR